MELIMTGCVSPIEADLANKDTLHSDMQSYWFGTIPLHSDHITGSHI